MIKTSHQQLSLPIFDLSNYMLAQIFMGIGILLRSIQFILNQGLREDEGHLAVNYITRDVLGMFQPLDNGQVAPPLFLVIEKISLNLFGQNEFALRYFSLLCSCLALWLAYKFLKEHTTPFVTTICIMFMAINRWTIYNTVAAKQYSTEVAIFILLFYILFCDHGFIKRNKIFLLGIIGALALWFSFTSIFILPVIGLYLLFSWSDFSKNEKYKLILTWSLWLVSFTVLYFVSIAHHPNRTIMDNYWSEHFMPLMPTSLNEWAWFAAHFRDMISFMFGFSNKHLVLWLPFSTLFILGIFYSYKNKEYRKLLWFLPIIFIHLVASGLKLYPFSVRLILYLSFPVYLFISLGVYHFIERVQKFISIKLFVPALFVLFASMSAITLINFPYQTEDIKKALAFAHEHWSGDESIFVYYPIDGCFDFYKDQYFPKDVAVVYNKESRKDYAGYDAQVKKLSGRVWFIFSHFYVNKNGEPDVDYIVHEAEKHGKIIKQMSSPQAAAYLIDFNVHP